MKKLVVVEWLLKNASTVFFFELCNRTELFISKSLPLKYCQLVGQSFEKLDLGWFVVIFGKDLHDAGKSALRLRFSVNLQLDLQLCLLLE